MLPLSKSDQDLCPLGIGVNFNCQNQVKLDKFDLQPPSPMVLILADNGLLVTFYAVNMDARNKSICVPPSKMQQKNFSQSVIQPPQRNLKLNLKFEIISR